MAPDDIVLGLSEPLLAAAQSPGLDGRRGWYLGHSHSAFCRLRAHFPGIEFAQEAGTRLNEAAARLANTVIELDAQLLPAPAGPERSLDWWSSDIAERSPYASSLLNIASRLAVFRQIMADPAPALVVVDDVALARLFWREAGATGRKIGWMRSLAPVPVRTRLRWSVGQALTSLVLGWRARLAGGKRLIDRIRHLRRLRQRLPLPVEALRAADVLLVVWGRRDTFQPGHSLEDAPWLGRVPAILRQNGLKLGLLVNPVWWVDPFPEIAANALACSEAVAFMEDAWSVTAVVRALLTRHPPVDANGRLSSPLGDLSAALDLECSVERTKWRPVHARLYAEVGRFLARHEIRPRAVLMLYENHGWERAFRIGLKRHLPATIRVGVQQSPFSPLYLNYIPSRRELNDDIAPDSLIVMGERFRDIHIATGFPPERLFLGGAPRYVSFLAGLERFSGDPVRPDTSIVLTCCGPDNEENRELVLKVALATKEMDGIRVVINFHPLTEASERQKIREFVTGQTGHRRLEWSDASVHTLINLRPMALFYCDTNSAFEGLAAGARPIHVGRDCGLDSDKLPDGASLRVRTIEEIRAALIAAKHDQIATAPAWQAIHDSMGPVDEAAFGKALGLIWHRLPSSLP